MKAHVFTFTLVWMIVFGCIAAAEALPEPAAHWRLDETAGTVAADSAGAADGQLYGPAWTQGLLGNGLLFDGMDDVVDVPGYFGVTGTGDRTCTAWIKTDSQQIGILLSWGAEQPGQKWMFRVEADGSLGVGVWDGYIQTLQPVNDGGWHHVAAVLADDGNPDVSEIRLYIDGQLQNTVVSNHRSINTAGGTPVLMGASETADVLQGYFTGILDDVRIYESALTETQIDQLTRILPPEPVLHLPFNESSGLIAPDNAGGHDGMLVNMSEESWTIGVESCGLQFDGINDYVVTVGYDGITGIADRTCSAWIKTTDTDGADIIGWGAAEPGRRWLLGIDTNGMLYLGVWDGYVHGSTPVNDGRWHHVAAVFENDGTPDVSEVMLYVDGAREAVSASSARMLDTAPGAAVTIGFFPGTSGRYFWGKIDDVRIYDTALTARMIRDTMEAYLPITVWVDDDYSQQGDNDGHVWGVNAFDRISQGIEAAEPGGRVSVAAGVYEEYLVLKDGVSVIGAGSDRCILNAANRDSAVYSQNCGPETVLAGFTITNASYSGMNNQNSRPTVADCVFLNNRTFRDGEFGGGGMFNFNSSPVVTRCRFIGNHVTYGSGGGICNYGISSPMITYCSFIGNAAQNGGGISNVLHNMDAVPVVRHCLFINNTASQRGGGVYLYTGLPSRLDHCTFYQNKAFSGGAIAGLGGRLTLDNSILWGNAAIEYGDEIFINDNLPHIRYSDVAGCGGSGEGWNDTLGIDGGGNIDTDPLFAGDDDVHLQSQAGRLNPSGQGPLWLQDAENSPCIDAGDPEDAVGDEPAANGGRVNMGAYGGTNRASKSSAIPGDLDGSGLVDLADFMILADNWLTGGTAP